jgi:hypothetical protein
MTTTKQKNAPLRDYTFIGGPFAGCTHKFRSSRLKSTLDFSLGRRWCGYYREHPSSVTLLEWIPTLHLT